MQAEFLMSELISIHVPREGDDVARRRGNSYGFISIHVPREGDDFRNLDCSGWVSYFNPRPP